MKMNSTSTSSSSSSSHQIPLHQIHSNNNHHHFGPTSSSSGDEFLDHVLGSSSSIPPPPWSDLANNDGGGGGFPVFDESAVLAAKLRQHQITPGGAAFAKLMLQQQLLMVPQGDHPLLDGSPLFKSPPPGGEEDPMQALFNGFASGSQQNFHHPQGQNFGMTGQQHPPPPPQPQGSGSTGGGGVAAAQQPKQRVRARRGQATDPHSIAERLRRERIADRMKSLQELVPNGNKADKASMLDEIIDYVKFLQLQVKVLSMSRLGGAAAVAPLVADMSSERPGADCVQASNGGALPRNTTQTTSDITEHQVAKLMDEDMGSAMQYLQGKGLCLMPISLATAISTATCHAQTSSLNVGGNVPSSPNMSAMTIQHSATGDRTRDGVLNDAASKP